MHGVAFDKNVMNELGLGLRLVVEADMLGEHVHPSAKQSSQKRRWTSDCSGFSAVLSSPKTYFEASGHVLHGADKDGGLGFSWTPIASL